MHEVSEEWVSRWNNVVERNARELFPQLCKRSKAANRDNGFVSDGLVTFVRTSNIKAVRACSRSEYDVLVKKKRRGNLAFGASVTEKNL